MNKLPPHKVLKEKEQREANFDKSTLSLKLTNPYTDRLGKRNVNRLNEYKRFSYDRQISRLANLAGDIPSRALRLSPRN